MLNLEVGQKAKALRSPSHYFKGGEVIEFVTIDEDNYYVFMNSEGLEQHLDREEFELL